MQWIEMLTKRGGSVRQYKALSGSWDTCAVGEAAKKFPAVLFMDFLQLGHEFHEEVYLGHRNRALKVYDQIQRRVRKLLRQAKR